MYGFHKGTIYPGACVTGSANSCKVSDVFHNGSPESPLWEFKHGNGNFKRGDLAGLRDIKRRASRHALIHRDSFPTSHKPSVSQPGTPAEPITDTGDSRLAQIEHSLYDMHARLMRTEESNTALSSKCTLLSDGLVRCQQVSYRAGNPTYKGSDHMQWSQDMSHMMLAMVPDPDSPLSRDSKLKTNGAGDYG